MLEYFYAFNIFQFDEQSHRTTDRSTTALTLLFRISSREREEFIYLRREGNNEAHPQTVSCQLNKKRRCFPAARGAR